MDFILIISLYYVVAFRVRKKVRSKSLLALGAPAVLNIPISNPDQISNNPPKNKATVPFFLIFNLAFIYSI